MDIRIIRSEIDGEVKAPPSKSYTHRAIIAGSLSKKAKIVDPLFSDDTISTINACRNGGAFFIRKGNKIEVGGFSASSGYINVENSGTTLRFFLSLSSLSPYTTLLDGDSSIRKRPNTELCLTLIKLGAIIKGGRNYTAPLKVKGVIRGGEVELNAKSSQFLSSLLFALPLVDEESCIKVTSIKSKPYVDITLHVLEESGIEIKKEDNNFYIYPSQYNLRYFLIPPDFSSMSYLISAGILAGKVLISNVFDSRQGDKIFIDIVREMGGDIKWKGNKIIAQKSELFGIEFDATNTPDLVPTIAILGAVARGETKIYNAEHLRIKESDRIKSICINLRRLGIKVEEREDGMIIRGGNVKGGIIDSFNDHRIAMAFSLLGLISDVIIRNAECVSVSFPNFFNILRRLGAVIV